MILDNAIEFVRKFIVDHDDPLALDFQQFGENLPVVSFVAVNLSKCLPNVLHSLRNSRHRFLELTLNRLKEPFNFIRRLNPALQGLQSQGSVVSVPMNLS